VHEVEPSSRDLLTRVGINANTSRIELLTVFESVLMERGADIDFISFYQDRSKFIEYVQVMRDLPKNCTERSSCLRFTVRAPSGAKCGGQHWTYGIDLPYLFRKDRAIPQRINVGRVETICLAITI